MDTVVDPGLVMIVAMESGYRFDKISGLGPLSGPNRPAQAGGVVVAPAMAFLAAMVGDNHPNQWMQDQ